MKHAQNELLVIERMKKILLNKICYSKESSLHEYIKCVGSSVPFFRKDDYIHYDEKNKLLSERTNICYVFDRIASNVNYVEPQRKEMLQPNKL